MNSRKSFWILLAIFLSLYTLLSYGGIRSPDGEIVFRVAESLDLEGSFAVSRDLENFRGFGLATGVDHKRYSQFGPFQSIAWVPFHRLGRILHDFGIDQEFAFCNPSHFVPNGLLHFLRRTKPADLYPHMLRFLASFLILFVSVANALLVWKITLRLTEENLAAVLTSLLFGLGTLMWPYAGACFSEPLAICFVLLSFDRMVANHRPSIQDNTERFQVWFPAGLFLGLSVATHITAILFVPFFTACVCYSAWKESGARHALNVCFLFLLGTGTVLGLLAYYNYARFGNPLETGRTADPAANVAFDYGHFVSPWRGLAGLIFSSGKSIFLFCPAIILGVIWWPHFHRSMRMLSGILLAAIVFRFIFIACWSDWNGGFCLGPRYLLMIIPFLILPVGFWIKEKLTQKQWFRLGIFLFFAFLCVSQQIYFSVGEIFSYYQFVIMKYKQQSISNPNLEQLYNVWSLSPVWNLHRGMRAPFMLQNVLLTNLQLWLSLTGIIGAVASIVTAFAFHRRER